MDRESVSKPLLLLNETQTILDRLLDQLDEIGDFEPIIVVGYDPTRFLKMFWDRATFAYAPAWKTTGPLYSLLCMSRLFKGSALVGYADQVTTTDALAHLAASSGAALVSAADIHSRRLALEDGKIVGIARPNEEPGWRYSFGGFAHFSEDALSPIRLQQVTGFEHVTIGCTIMGFTAVLGNSINVNTLEDLERARREFT